MSSVGNANTAVNHLRSAESRVNGAANHIANNRMGSAQNSAKAAANSYGSAYSQLNAGAKKLANIATQTNNRNIRAAANYLNKAAIHAAKASTARSLVMIGKAAESLGKAANQNALQAVNRIANQA